MKIPCRIKLGGHEVAVEHRQTIVNENEECLGLCLPEQLKILIKQGMPKSREKEVFIHEVIEMINSLFELEMNHGQINTLALEIAGVIK